MTTDQDASQTIFCPRCSVELPAGAAQCSHCHAPLTPCTASPARDRDSLFSYLDNPWIMLGMLFLVTAGTGVPFLWKSKAFGWFGKTVLTLIMIPYTAVILWWIYLLVAQIYGDVQDVLQSW